MTLKSTAAIFFILVDRKKVATVDFEVIRMIDFDDDATGGLLGVVLGMYNQLDLELNFFIYTPITTSSSRSIFLCGKLNQSMFCDINQHHILEYLSLCKRSSGIFEFKKRKMPARDLIRQWSMVHTLHHLDKG